MTRSIERTRNFGIMAHVDAGKTTVAEQLLYHTGAIHRVGKVHEGNTALDFHPEEAERGITIKSAATTLYWEAAGETHRLQLIDTPGHVDFTLEVERALRVLDGAIAVFDAVAGVEPQSETVWRQAERHGVPSVALINKMDRPGATTRRTLEMMRERLNASPALLQLPWGEGADFAGVYDLIEGTLRDRDGALVPASDIPEALRQDAEAARSALLEAVAEVDDAMMALYLDDAPIDAAELRAALRRATLARSLVPVLVGSALHDVGMEAVLDAVVRYLPSPLDVPAVQGFELDGEREASREASSDAPLAALAFKVMTDDYVGQLTLTRIYAGTLHSGDRVLNTTRGKRETVGRMVRMYADKRQSVDVARAGDIVALVGLKNTLTGDTLSATEAPILLDAIDVPEPVVWAAIEVEGSQERAKLGVALRRVTLEDPSLQVRTLADTGQTLLGGMGELHLEVTAQRLVREFKARVQLGEPRVALLETIARGVEHRERLKKMTGGPGMFAEVCVHVAPGERGSGLVFKNAVQGGAIQASYIAAVEAGLRDSATSGPFAGHPLTDLVVTLLDGSEHPVDSSERAFALAGGRALQEAARKAGAVLLEPVMAVEAISPEASLSGVIGELNSRRGVVQQIEARGDLRVAQIQVPLAEMFGFTGALRGLTQGRGASSMHLSGYRPVPASLKERVLRRAS